MTKPLILSLMALSGVALLALPVGAQRVDSRVGGGGPVQQGAPRPYSAPGNATVTRQTAIGPVQSRIGSNGQIITDPNVVSSPTAGPRTTSEPQLMRGLAPEAVRASAPVAEPAPPAVRATKATVRPSTPRRRTNRRRIRRR